ncbi:endonuclease [Pseudoalteromonas spongiae]|uniref:Endonuclease n=1 Tax=Pseudoalteromonas spongiae TaxID=298657 RepID=A0ABU8ESR1_9GAMM
MKKLLALALILASSSAIAKYPSSFSNAKKKAEKEVYFDQFKTFYCQCDFVFDDLDDVDNDGDKKETKVDPKACGYEARNAITSSGKENERVSRIEWEHVMPANIIGGHLDQWQNPENYEECLKKNGKSITGRKCAVKTVPEFKRAYIDLNNLVPAVGELNADRSNYSFANIEGEVRAYGKCDFEVDFASDTAEPADNVKGNIARIYLHMKHEHKVPLNEHATIQMLEWSKLDPVDAWECKRNERIEEAQGLGNKFVKEACSKQ